MSDSTEHLAKYTCNSCGESFWLQESYGHTGKGDTHKCFCDHKAVRLGKASWWAVREEIRPPEKSKKIEAPFKACHNECKQTKVSSDQCLYCQYNPMRATSVEAPKTTSGINSISRDAMRI